MTSARQTKRLLVARAMDADNINAQSRNAKDILRRWRSEEWRPVALAFGEPDAAVAANPRVEIVKLKPSRGWRLRLWQLYQNRFDAIFYPGIHHRADYWALRTRNLTGRRAPLISTFEGLSGRVDDDSREKFYEREAGHRVFCQKVTSGHLARIEWIHAASDHIVAISPFLARLASARFGPKVSHLALGVDMSAYRRADEHVSTARPMVVAAGNVRDHKRPDVFLDLARRFPQADFQWFGEGEKRASLQAEASRLGLGNLSFPGLLSAHELATALCAADIFAFPSKNEGVPKVTQEAAAAGLAQVIFGFFEAPSVVDGVNGFVVWDDAQFVDRIAQLINSPQLVARMGRAGIDLARCWDWDQLAPLWEGRILQAAESVPAKFQLAEAQTGP